MTGSDAFLVGSAFRKLTNPEYQVVKHLCGSYQRQFYGTYLQLADALDLNGSNVARACRNLMQMEVIGFYLVGKKKVLYLRGDWSVNLVAGTSKRKMPHESIKRPRKNS